MHYGSGTLSATGNTNAISLTWSTVTPPGTADTQAVFQLSGTFTGASVKTEGLGFDNNWYPILAMDLGSFASTSGGTAISLTNSTNKSLFVSTVGFQGVRVWASALSTGSVAVQIVSGNFSDNFLATGAVATGANLVSAQTITSTSADALAVGPAGTSNPTFQVDASVSSAATGLDIQGQAAGSGLNMTVISSGNGEAGNLIGGAGSGSTAGGTMSVKGGIAGTTSAGGIAQIVGGAGGSTSGTGGVAQVVGGAGTASTAIGGAAKLIGGASAGASGTAGAAQVDAGAATGGTKAAVIIGDANAGATYLNRGPLAALQVGLTLTALGTVQSSTPTSAQLLGGLLSQTGSTGAGTVTLPTGTALSAACNRTPVVGDSFDCEFYNLGGSQTLTITGATGTTVIGTAAVPTGKMAKMKFYNTGSNTWNIYCIVSA